MRWNSIEPRRDQIHPASSCIPNHDTIPNRKARSLFGWVSRVTGVDACWIEGINAEYNPVWGIAKKLTRRIWYIISGRLKPVLAVSALGAALLIPIHTLHAQTGIGLNALNGNNGYVLNGEAASDYSGGSVATGDINGDGFEDLIIGAYQADPNTIADAGATYVVFGGHIIGSGSSIELSGLDGSDGFVINGRTASDFSGFSVASGDINGDNVDDVVIGAYGADANGAESGETYVVFGGGSVGSTGTMEISDLSGSNGFTLNGIDGDDFSGNSVASGDINGDGTDDLIIGAYGTDQLMNGNEGETYVIFGGSGVGSGGTVELSVLSGSDGFVLTGIDRNDQSGNAVAAGDINGDSIDDVIIGAKAGDASGNNSGETYVVFGKTTAFNASIPLANLNGSNGFVLNGAGTGDESGKSVAAGDINGDGTGDVIIGASEADPNGNASGATYVVFGSGSVGSSGTVELSGLSGSDGFVLNGIANMDRSGTAVSSGDINGDGTDDVITGASQADPGGNSAAGQLYVVFGNNSGFSSPIELSALSGNDGFALNGIDPSDYSGRALAAGDFNGDGIDEVAVGASEGDPNAAESGETYLFFNGHAQTIDGGEGFRTLSAPSSGAVFDDLLGNFWTQGFTGSDGNPSDDDNVWVWDETLDNDGDWVGLSDQAADNLDAGQGFLFYIFSDDDFDGTPEGFPKRISRLQFGGGGGTLNSGSVTPVNNLGDGRFFLAGNPYVWTVDWDRMTKTNLTEIVYVYDDATSSWLSWSDAGQTGNLTDGLIAPFQGFFIEGMGGSGSLTIEEADTVTTEGTFYKQAGSGPLVLELELEGDGLKNPAFLQFDERADAGRDRYDGLELQPLSNNYLQLFSATGDGTSLNINALPGEGTFEIPLRMLRVEEGVSTDADATLRWNGLDKFPAGWRFLLVDTRTGEEINLHSASEHPVSISAGSRDKASGQELNVPVPVMQSADGEPRYVLRVTAGEAAGPSEELPAAVALRQNYPNPFNPATVIRFELPEARNVNLEVYDLSGRRIATLLDEQRSAGRHQVQWAPENLASGLYLYKLRAGDRVITRKMMLIK